MSRIARFLSGKIKLNGIEEDVMEYVVLFNLVSQAYYLTVCVLCGCILKSMTAALAFFLAFNLLRRYSGGVHASTEMRCTVMSTLMIVAVLIGVKLIPFELLSLRLIFSLTSFPVIALLAPVVYGSGFCLFLLCFVSNAKN
ncbi:MAG: accessory gene regulator B family protein [Clostridia bacterium]|nr:accessory gene regulator B family protein [Clostridia bacterium]